jgi:Terminase small subunit
VAFKKPKRKRLSRTGEALYAAETLKPGVTRVDAALKAGLDYVPNGKRIQEIRERLVQTEFNAAGLTTERIVLELMRVGFLDPGRIFDGYRVKHITEMDEDTRAAIAGFDVERRRERSNEEVIETEVLKPRFANKNQALEILLKYSRETTGTANRDRIEELVRAMQAPADGAKHVSG